MRKIELILFISIFSILVFRSTFSLSCNIVNGNCPAGYSCLFSISSPQNAHAGMCGYYSYSVCCDNILSYINQTCNSSFSPILSFYQQNNTHVGYANYYTWKLCAAYPTYPLECVIKSGACESDEICIISLYSTVNSHVGDCNYYQNKLCCKMLSDLMIDSSSIRFPTQMIFGNNVSINITVFNIGDANAYNVNVSCYENGKLFDSKIISVIPKGGGAEVSCMWNVSCLTNISVRVDPDNLIKELNESNNEAWQVAEIIEYLNVNVEHPENGQSFYRGRIIWLNSTVNSSCNPAPAHTTYWFNESTLIGIGDDIQWQIPIDDSLLGKKKITAYVNSSNARYIPSSSSINITILNNLPSVTVPRFNITEAEVHSGEGVQILCNAYDLEDCPHSNYCLVNVNISIRNPDGIWINSTASKIGNTFYVDYTAPFYPLGYYTVYCSVSDSDSGYNESFPSIFLVYQNASLTINLNSSYYHWGEGVRISGNVKRVDKTPVSLSDIKVYLEGKLVCNTTTNLNGEYSCDFKAPASVGNYKLIVEAIDMQTEKIFTNSTLLIVKVVYGVEEDVLKRARQASCHEVPQLIINPDGSIKQVFVKVCILT